MQHFHSNGKGGRYYSHPWNYLIWDLKTNFLNEAFVLLLECDTLIYLFYDRKLFSLFEEICLFNSYLWLLICRYLHHWLWLMLWSNTPNLIVFLFTELTNLGYYLWTFISPRWGGTMQFFITILRWFFYKFSFPLICVFRYSSSQSRHWSIWLLNWSKHAGLSYFVFLCYFCVMLLLGIFFYFGCSFIYDGKLFHSWPLINASSVHSVSVIM